MSKSSGITMFVLDPATQTIRRHPAVEPRFEVHTRLFGERWENCFLTDDQPTSFASGSLAQAALREHLAAMQQAVRDGHLADAQDAEDFRIVEVSDA